jgi:Spy/CpxP family protein refolding chaperone
MEGKQPEKRAVTLVVVVFLLGIALGGIAVHMWAHHHASRAHSGHHTPTKIVQDMTDQVGLTPDQQKQVLAIIDDTRAKYQAISAQMQPQFEQARADARGRIRALLTPEQLPKFEEFIRRVDEERKKRERDHH